MSELRCAVYVVLLGLISYVGDTTLAQGTISPLVQSLVSPVSDTASQDLRGIRQALLSAGGAIEADLITAFSAGPPPSTLTAITTGKVAEYEGIQTWLSANAATSGFDSQTTSSILLQSPQQLAQADANRYAFRYQSNALTYLAPIAGPSGKALLTNLASNSHSPFQSVASLAIANNFSNLWAAYEAIGARQDKFNLQGYAELSPGHSVNPVSSDTIVRLGSFVALIPAGAFTVLASTNNVYIFSGPVNISGGVTVELTMAIVVTDPLPKLAKRFGPTLLIGLEGSGVDLSTLPAPVEAGLMLGATGGTTKASRL